MKTFVLLAASAAWAAAQDLSSLPACGQTCINNMIGLAQSQMGCASGDVSCYCSKPDFGYGVRDCSDQACSNSQQAESVISFGSSYCASALSAHSATASGSSVTGSELTTPGHGSRA
ncbi:hypothetical protein M433DRAFT_70375 [Acidomyces richmondensis BFW]|nr:hypothetical protein M433DRAFT_70375 [Acidomyces richmondensis BFW]